MTTTTEDSPDQLDQVDDEPRQVDLLDQLTIAEIDAGSRQLGSSLVGQISSKGDRYEQALAVVLWLHRRRTDRTTEPAALLRQLGKLRFVELQEQLTALSQQLAEDDKGPLGSRPA